MTGSPRLTLALAAYAALLVPLLWTVTAQAEEAQATEATVIQPDGGDRLWVFAQSSEALGSGGEFHIYVDPETHPAAKASFAKFSLGPGGQLPVHRHDKTEEISYFLSGTGSVQTIENGELVEVGVTEGSVWYVPPGSWHAIRNTGNEPLTLVFATIPNEEQGLLSFFRDIGVEPGQEAKPLVPEEFAAMAAEHDLILRPQQPEDP